MQNNVQTQSLIVAEREECMNNEERTTTKRAKCSVVDRNTMMAVEYEAEATDRTML